MADPVAESDNEESERVPSEWEALADRLRFAAESLTHEFEGLLRADAERLIFDVARQFLSDAQVAQFVPTFATRRARQLLRDRPVGVEVIPDDDPFEGEQPGQAHAVPAPPNEPVGTTVAGPVPPPAYFAIEAKRLLERAKALRAATLVSIDQT